MNKVLYEDNKFELAIDNIGLYIRINESRYELSSHPYEPCTYIKSQDGAVDIVMHGAFDFGIMISSSGEWDCPNHNPLSLCETLEAAILKDKVRKKQQIVNETGYKTACDIRKSISYRERNVMYEKNNGYSWSDIKDKKIKTIGYYWQAGIGVGTIDAHMIWFVYFGSPNKNDTFFTIAEITEQEYFDLQKKYEEFLYDDVEGIPSKQVASEIVKEIAEYVRNSKIIAEGWDLI